MDRQSQATYDRRTDKRSSRLILRRHMVAGWVLALLLAWLWSLAAVEPVAAQGTITQSTPCSQSSNLTNLGSSRRGITNQPLISGNGARVTFWSVNDITSENADGNIEVFLRESNNSIVQLTHSVGSILGGFNLEPSINTAGTQVAFFSDRDLVPGENADGNFEIFLARRANNGTWSIRQITDTEGFANLFPSIDGDGNRIVFVSEHPTLDNTGQGRSNEDSNFEIFLATIPANGEIKFQQLTNTGAGVTNDQPVINAAGTRVAYTSANGQEPQIFVWDETIGTPIQLTQSDSNDQPTISADGTAIVYVATKNDRSRVVLHHLSEDGSESSASVIFPPNSGSQYRTPSVDAHGDRVVFVEEQGTGDAIQINVLLYDDHAKRAVRITEEALGTWQQPAISNDGTRVTYVGIETLAGAADNDGSDIYMKDCPVADLNLEFVADPISRVLAGVNIQYQLRVTNNGPSVAEATSFHMDLGELPGLPANVNRILPSNCDIDNNDLRCPLGNIAVDASKVFTIGYEIPSNAELSGPNSQGIVNQIDVSANAVDSDTDDNVTRRFITTIYEESALALQVTTDRDIILAGSPDELTYDLIVTNAGPSQARGTLLEDDLPDGVTLVSAQLVQGGGNGADCPLVANDDEVTCQLGDLTAGSNTVVRIIVRAKASAPPSFSNTATVSTQTTEPNTDDNEVTTVTAVDRAADMVITKVASPRPSVVAGREITYTVFVTNAGFADTENITLIDSLPQNVTFVRDISPEDATCTPSAGGQIVTCDLPGDLLVGESRSLSLVAFVQSIVPAGPITNTVRVFSDRRDPNPLNDISPAVVTEVRLLADLAVSKTVDKSTPDINETVTFTVKVRNEGPSQAYNVVVTDTLPNGMTFVGATTSVGDYDPASGVWTIGTMPLFPTGQEQTLTIRAFATSSIGGQLTVNTATAGGSQPEPAGGFPSTASVSIRPQMANVRVLKTASPSAQVTAGQLLTYTLAVRNLGPSLARSVSLTDVLPSNVFLVSATEPVDRPNCSTGATVRCNIGDIAANTELIYTVVVTRALKGTITNTVSVGSLTPDIAQANNRASVIVLVNPEIPARLAFTTQPPGSVTAGAVFDPLPKVEIRDRFNNLIHNTVGSTDSIRLTPYTNPTCTTLATPADLSNFEASGVAGVATFDGISYTKAETIYLKAEDLTSSGVATTCSKATQVIPDVTTKLLLTTPPRTLKAGEISQAITVERRDQFDNLNRAGNFVVTLRDSSRSGRFLNASNALIGTITIPNNAPSVSFFYTDTVVGSYVITASAAPGVTPASQPIEVIAAPASELLVVITAPVTTTAGVKSSVITVERIDQYGNPNASDPTLTISLDSDSVVADQFFNANLSDNTIIVTTTIPHNESRVSFRYRNTLAEEHRLLINDIRPDGINGAFWDVTIVPAATDHLVFATSEHIATAGVNSPVIQVAREDEFGNRNFDDPDLTLTLDSSSSTPHFTPTSPVIPQGSDHVDFVYRDTVVGTYLLTASSGSLGSATQHISVIAAAASKLVVLTSPQVVIAGQPSTPITIQRRDQFDNPAPNGGNLEIFLSSPSLNNEFLPVSSLTPISSVTITQTDASFRYRDTTQGAYVLSFSDNAPGPFDAGQTITVTAASATKLVFTQKPLSVTAGVRSSVFVLERQDQFNNPNSTSGAVTINLTTTSTGTVAGGAPRFFRGNGTTVVTSVQIPANSPTTTFFYNDSRAGTPLLTADDSGALAAATTNITVNPDTTKKLVTITPQRTVVAGELSQTITVERRDQFENPNRVGDLTVTLSGNSPTAGTFRNASNNTISNVVIANNAATASFFYRDIISGTFNMVMSAGAGIASTSQQVRIVPAAASELVIVSSPVTTTAGVRSGIFTVQRFDPFGNPNSTDATVTLDLQSDSTFDPEFYSQNLANTTPIATTTIAQGSSTGTFRYQDTRAEDHAITVDDQNATGGLQSDSVDILVVPAATDHLVFSSTARTVVAGVNSDLIQVAREDEFGNHNFDDPDLDVTLASSSAGAPDFIPDSPVTIQQGDDFVEFRYADTLAGTHTLTATSGTLGADSQEITVTAAAASQLVVLTSPQLITAGVSSDVITVQRQDQFDNPTSAGGDLEIFLTTPSPAGEFLPATSLTPVISSVTITNTDASFRYRDEIQDVIALDFSDGGALNASQTITITADDAVKLVFTQKPSGVLVGMQSSAFVVERQDQFDNANATEGALVVNLTTTSTGTVVGGPARFTDGVSVVTSVQIPANGSNATFFYNDTRAGEPLITADDAGPLVAATTTITVMVEASAAAQVVFISAPVTATAGVNSAPITIQQQDAYGNAVAQPIGSPLRVDLTTSANSPPARFSDLAQTAVIDHVDIEGSSTAQFRYYDEKAGTPLITADDVGPFAAVDQQETVVAAQAAKLIFFSAPVTLTAGVLSPQITIQRLDQFDNPNASDPALTVDLDTNTAGDFFNATANTPLPGDQLTIGLNSSVASFRYTDTLRGSPILSVSKAGLTGDTQQETVLGAAAARLKITGSGTQVAGVAQQLGLLAFDAFGNQADPYTGTHTLRFGGASISLNNTTPTVNNVAGGDINFGADTTIHFTAGIADVGGSMKLYRAETAMINALDPSANIQAAGADRLTVVVSPATRNQVRVENTSGGGNLIPDGTTVTADSTLTLWAVGRDPYLNTTGNVANASWVLTPTGGVTTNDISPTTGPSTTFAPTKLGTAKIKAFVTGDGFTESGLITVLPSTPFVVNVELTADGSGGVVPNTDVAAGAGFTVYAVARDDNDNYIGNVAADWQMINETGDVLDSDLVPSPDDKSAVFTGRRSGTGQIKATVTGIPNFTPSGVLTVIPGIASTFAISIVNPSGIIAGQERDLTITAYDAFGSIATSYDGNRPLRFTGPLSSTRPVFPPTVVDMSNVARVVGTQTMINFVDGVAQVTSPDTLDLTLYRATTNGTLSVSDILSPAITSNAVAFTVSAQATVDKLSIDGPTTLDAGVAVSLTLRAEDIYGNLVASFAGFNRRIVYSSDVSTLDASGRLATTRGADIAPLSPTPGQEDEVEFGLENQVDFFNGVAQASDGATQAPGNFNAWLTIRKVGTFVINVDQNLSGVPQNFDKPSGALTVTVNAGPLASFAWSVPSSQTNNVIFTNGTITAQDQFQNPILDYDVNGDNVSIFETPDTTATVTLVNSVGNNVLESSDFVNGVTNLNAEGLRYTGPAGTITLRASTQGGIFGDGIVTILPGPLATLSLAGPASAVAGTPFNVILTARDGSANSIANGPQTVTFTGATNSPNGSIPTADGNNFGTPFSVNFTNGVAVIAINLRNVQPAGLIATINGINSNTRNVNVQAGALNALVWAATSPQTNNVPFTGANTLTATDSSGNVITNFNTQTNPVTISQSTQPTGTVDLVNEPPPHPDIVLENADFTNGVANLTNRGLTYTGLAGSIQFVATSQNAPVVVGTTNVTIQPNAPAAVRLIGPSSATAGVPFNVLLEASDISGNHINGLRQVNFTGASASPGGSAPTWNGHPFNQAFDVTFTGGYATVSLDLRNAAATNLTAVVAGILSNQLVVNVAANTLGALVWSNPIANQANDAVWTAGTLTAKDAYSNTITAFDTHPTNNITISATNQPTATISTATGNDAILENTDFVNGVATFSTLGLKYTGLSGSVIFRALSASGASSLRTVTILTGSFERLRWLVTNNQTNGNNFTGVNRLTATDISGNIITNFTSLNQNVTLSQSTQPTGTVILDSEPNNDDVLENNDFVNGIADLTNRGLRYTGLSGTIHFVATSQSGKTGEVDVTILPFGPVTLRLIGPSSATAGTPFNVLLEASDTSGNHISDGPRQVSFTGASASPGGSAPTWDGHPFNQAFNVNFTGGYALVPLDLRNAAATNITAVMPAISLNSNVLVVNVAPSTLGALVWSNPIPNQTNDVAWTAGTLTAKDAYSNTITAFNTHPTNNITISATNRPTSTISIANSGGDNVLENADFVNGVANLSTKQLKYTGLSGSVIFQALSASGASSLRTVTILPGSFQRLALSGPTTAVAGTPFNVTLTAADVSGNLVSPSPQISFSGASASPKGTTPTANGNAFGVQFGVTFSSGLATVSLSLPNAVLTQLTATANGSIVSNQYNVLVGHGALAGFAVSITSPQVLSQTLTGAVNTITAQDAFSNTVTNFDAGPNNVTVTRASGSAAPYTITGLGSGGGNILDQDTDFVNGVADLTGKLRYNSGTAATIKFRFVSGTRVGESNPVTYSQPTSLMAVDGAITELAASNNGPTVLGADTSFDASALGNNINYTWDFGDGTTGNGASPLHSYDALGNYTAIVTARNDLGSETATTLVTVVDTAITEVQANNDGPTLLGRATLLSASAAGSNIIYSWDFGDGASGEGAAPSHTYAAAGSYTATVTARNGSDTKTASTLVTIDPLDEEENWLAPVAVNDNVSTVENLAVGGNVLGNDHDPQASPLTAAAFSQPAHGTMTLAVDGAFTYLPAPGFAGSDHFSYVVSNTYGLTATAEVGVVVADLPETAEQPTAVEWTPGVTTTQLITAHNYLISLQVPADAYSGTLGAGETLHLLYTPVITPTGDVDAIPGDLRFAGMAFKLESYLDAVLLAHHSFTTPLVLEIVYPAAAVEGLDPEALTLLSWDDEGNHWQSEGIAVLAHDAQARMIRFAISHLSEFALFAQPVLIDAQMEIFLPKLSH